MVWKRAAHNLKLSQMNWVPASGRLQCR